MGLIQQLKQEHVEILRLTEEGDLKVLKEVLLSHLDVENKLLYPKFSNSKDEKARRLGKKFSSEMIKISKVAMAFFSKYENENVSELKSSEDFKKEFVEIVGVVGKRIKVEEEILFPAYERHCEGEA